MAFNKRWAELSDIRAGADEEEEQDQQAWEVEEGALCVSYHLLLGVPLASLFGLRGTTSKLHVRGRLPLT